MIIVRTIDTQYNFRPVKIKVGLCDHCGKEVELYSFTNTCDCGADYSISGQRLAPRSQWGEETGESYSDIVNHDYENHAEVDY